MSSKVLVRLGVAALVLVGLALWLGGQRGPQRELASDQPLLPGLSEALNDIDRVQLRGAGGETLATLERGDDGWTLAERGGYAVDAGALRTLLLGLAQARRVEAKTARPERHADLGVEDVAAEDAQGVEVDIRAGEREFQVIIGKNRGGGAVGTYARPADGPQSWLIDANLSVERNPARWLQRDLAQIDAARLDRVEVGHGDGDRIEISRGEDGAGELALANLPRGREPASEYVAEATAGFLSALRFDDVAPEGERNPPEDAAALSQARFAARDGIEVAVEFWTHEAQTWARFEAILDEARAGEWIAAEQAREQREHEALVAELAASAAAAKGEGEDAAEVVAEAVDAAQQPEPPLAVSDPEADREARRAALDAELAALQARFDGWVYRIPSHKADNLTRRLDDYLAAEGE